MVALAEQLAELAQGGPLFRAEQALTERLADAFPPARFCHQVAPAKINAREWGRLTARLPAVARGFQAWDGRGATQRHYGGTASWLVYLISSNPRREELLRGDARGVGQLGMLQLAACVLHGWTVPGLGSWRVGAAQNAYSDEWGDEATGLVVLDVMLDVQLEVSGAVAAQDDFLRLAGAWDVDPHSGAAPDVAETVQNVRGG